MRRDWENLFQLEYTGRLGLMVQPSFRPAVSDIVTVANSDTVN
jgi:hypothetical protein